MKTKIILLILTTSFTLPVDGQKMLDNYFLQVRAGKSPNFPTEINIPEYANTWLTALKKYTADTTLTIRLKAFAMISAIGIRSKESAIRVRAVQQLVSGVRDKNTGVKSTTLSSLSKFRKKDFSQTAIDTLMTLCDPSTPHLDVILKLVGYLEYQPANRKIFTISQDPSTGRKERWSAMLALARMDDDLAAQDVMNRVQRMPVSDAVVYQIFPDLVYTRRKEAIALLIQTLNSDAKNCESADAEHGGKIPCAYRVMEMLAPAIENYPLKISESGDVETTDYPGALENVRNWLKEHPDYKILKDKF